MFVSFTQDVHEESIRRQSGLLLFRQVRKTLVPAGLQRCDTLLLSGCNHCTQKHSEWKLNSNIFILLECCRVGGCVLNHLHRWLNENETCAFKDARTQSEAPSRVSLSRRCNDLLVGAAEKLFAIPPSFSSPLLPDEQSHPFIISCTIMYLNLGMRGENGRIDWKQIRLYADLTLGDVYNTMKSSRICSPQSESSIDGSTRCRWRERNFTLLQVGGRFTDFWTEFSFLSDCRAQTHLPFLLWL